jgi:uncharacterized protein YggL (DUF469 family)
MQYTFSKVKESLPKTSARSKRTIKKLHLNEFAESLVSIDLTAGLFDSPFEGELLDAIYEYDDSTFIGGSSNATNILIQIKSSDFSEEYIKKYCEDLLFILSNIEPQFAEIGHITVQYGDAYYGEW